jgi:glucokinase
MENRFAVGVDIGGTKIAVGLVGRDGAIFSSRTVSTPVRDGPDAIIQQVISLSRGLLSEAALSGFDVVGIGVGTAGQVDSERGIIRYANENLPGWTGTPVAQLLSEALSQPVAVDNDVKTMALGEGRYGAGAGFDEIFYITVGTGIGGAIVHGGKIWRGATGSAGEVGYIVAGWEGKRPLIIEQQVGGPALAARYCRAAGEPDALTLTDVTQRALKGDELARQVIRDGAQMLGQVFQPIINLLDPQIFIIGGGVSAIGDLWWQPFETALRDTPLPTPANVKLAAAQLGTQAVMVGAACLAFEAGGLQNYSQE